MLRELQKTLGAALFVSVFAAALLAQGADTRQSSESDHKADTALKSIARINPSTLAMELGVPMWAYPGRAGNSTPFGINYSSKLWRMENAATYFYYTPIGGYRQYVTQLRPLFAERTAAGWSSTLGVPIIEETTDIYTETGRSFGNIYDEELFNAMVQERLTNTIINPGDCDCAYDHGFCPAYCSLCHYNSDCIFGDGGPGGGGGGTWDDDLPPESPPQPPIMHYVKRVFIRMGDGATHEFRKSDGLFGYCDETHPSENQGPNCEGMGPDNLGSFLSVDGTGMRLERTSSGSTLFLSDGSRYLFPALSTGFANLSVLFEANKFIDSNGNSAVFSTTTENGKTVRRVYDTLGRELVDPLPKKTSPEDLVTEGDQQVSLPGFNGGSYVLKWRHLKPVPCDENITTNCGSPEGALENQQERLYHYGPNTCFGSAYALVDPNGQNPPANQHPDEIMFPNNGLGLRSCNPFRGEAPSNIIPLRFNPVVLAAVVLPNGRSYQFSYNQFGEITKVVYPTGSYERFTYSRIPPINGFSKGAYDQTNRGVSERRVYSSDDILQQRWTYSAAMTGTYPNTVYKITTAAPGPGLPEGQGLRTERYLHTNTRPEHDPFGFEDPRTGMPFDERTYDSTGQLVSRTLTEWTYTGPEPTGDPLRPASTNAKRDARVARSIRLKIENGQALATLSENTYQDPTTDAGIPTDPSYFSRLNIKQTKSHHFRSIPLSLAETGTLAQIAGYFNNSTVAVVSETDYIYDEGYKNRGMVGLARESRTLDPSDGSTIAKSQTIYDNQVPAPAPGYPTGYSLLGYTGIATSFDCASTGEPARICWSDPGVTLPRGNVTTKRVWKKEDDSWIETHTRYDIFGNAVAARDPIGNETTTLFENSTAKPYRYAYPSRVDTPTPDPSGVTGTNEGSFTTSTFDFMTGLALTTTDEFGQTTKTDYLDPLLRPTKVYGINGFNIPVTETIYDDTNLWVKVRKQLDETNWDESTTYLDSFGRAIKTQAKDSQGDVFVETHYDNLGRVDRVTNPYRIGDTIYWSKTRYDELGRPVETYAPIELANLANAQSLGTTSFDISTVTGFVGTVVTSTDASGRKGRSITNALGQLLRVDEPTAIGGTADADLGTLASPAQPTYYTYSPQGKLVRVQQGVQNRYFNYDSLGRLLRVSQPEQEVNAALDLADPYNTSGQWTAGFAYDVLGNVVRATDANGVNIVNEYDRASRVTKRCYTKPNISSTATTCAQIATGDVSTDTPAVNFYYDGKGLASQQSPNYAKGKLTKVDNGFSATEYMTFDNFGRLIRSKQITDGVEYGGGTDPTYWMTYTYNLSGALTEERYPSGRVVKNEFESDGDLSRIHGKANPTATERTYANTFLHPRRKDRAFEAGKWFVGAGRVQ